jgi:FHA domain
MATIEGKARIGLLTGFEGATVSVGSHTLKFENERDLRWRSTPIGINSANTTAREKCKLAAHLTKTDETIMSLQVWGKLVPSGGSDLPVLHSGAFVLFEEGEGHKFGRVLGAGGSSQYVLPFAHVSSTHFLIRCQKSTDGEPPIYYLKNLGKNGTFVNGEAAQGDVEKHLHTGDIISLRFKQDTKLEFKFEAMGGNLQSSPTDAMLAAQVSTLNAQLKKHESDRAESILSTEKLSQENSDLQRVIKITEASLNAKEEEVAELKRHLQDIESDRVANAARTSVLQDENNALKEEISKTKTKLSTANEELSRIKEQHDLNTGMLDAVNLALVQEGNSRKSSEKGLADTQKLLVEANKRAARFETANGVLQGGNLRSISGIGLGIR